MCWWRKFVTINTNIRFLFCRCTLCFGTAGMAREQHSRTTCPKLLVHGVSKTLKLQDLENVGARSPSLARPDQHFNTSNLSQELPSSWVHVVIQDFFAAPICGVETLIFKVAGLDNIGDVIVHPDTFVLFGVLFKKFNKCMKGNQAKKVMILSHSAGRLTHEHECADNRFSATIGNHTSDDNGPAMIDI